MMGLSCRQAFAFSSWLVSIGPEVVIQGETEQNCRHPPGNKTFGAIPDGRFASYSHDRTG